MTPAPLLDWQPPPSPYPDGIPPEVCRLFEELANELRNLGWERYSADALVHQIRWRHHIERGDRGFVANNNWTPVLARWFIARNPTAKKFFELREARKEDA